MCRSLAATQGLYQETRLLPSGLAACHLPRQPAGQNELVYHFTKTGLPACYHTSAKTIKLVTYNILCQLGFGPRNKDLKIPNAF